MSEKIAKKFRPMRTSVAGLHQSYLIRKRDLPDVYYHGPIREPQHTKWKEASKKTLLELLYNGSANQAVIERLETRYDVDVELELAVHQMAQLDLSKQTDVKKFIALVREDNRVLRAFNRRKR